MSEERTMKFQTTGGAYGYYPADLQPGGVHERLKKPIKDALQTMYGNDAYGVIIDTDRKEVRAWGPGNRPDPIQNINM